jgi:hypothetical protein
MRLPRRAEECSHPFLVREKVLGMTLLDLQGMHIQDTDSTGGGGGGSQASLLLCGDSSLSVTTCN